MKTDEANLALVPTDGIGVAFAKPPRSSCRLDVVVDQRPGLLAVDVEPVAHGLFLVVVALDQVFARPVALALGLRRVEFDVMTTLKASGASLPGEILSKAMGVRSTEQARAARKRREQASGAFHRISPRRPSQSAQALR